MSLPAKDFATSTFVGGQISKFPSAWRKISSDPWLLGVVKGVEIPFVQTPVQEREPYPYKLAGEESDFVDKELDTFLSKGIIEEVELVQGQVISNIFLRPKKDGSFRLILDLTWTNLHVEYEHFKMHSLQTALHMMRPDCWMGSIDLKDAYYSVLIREKNRKFLRFRWRNRLFEFRVLPNGLACAPRIFTKLLSPVFAHLRERGHECFPYIDDSFVVADSEEKCRQSLKELGDVLTSLGFVLHPDKPVTTPTRSLTFLGFQLDSDEFRVFLTEEKKGKVVRAAVDLLERQTPSIREVAGFIGLTIAFSQAFKFGEAHTKLVEIEKAQSLREAKGNFDAQMQLSNRARQDIRWWIENIECSGKLVRMPKAKVTLHTDASNEGWGAHTDVHSTGGRWSQEEEEDHINVLELRAVRFGLQSLCEMEQTHIKIMTDNTTALAYVKHQGGVKSLPCNDEALKIWEWCEQRDNWLTIAHIPGVDNVLADFKSRNFADNIEWELNENIFQKVIKVFGQPDIDLFASRLNRKTEKFVSWQPDPEATAIDAFSLDWSDSYFYAFPPFSCVALTIEKIVEEGASGILVVPWWPTQAWWGRLISLGLRRLKFRKKKNNLLPSGKPENVQFLSSAPLGAFRF